MYKTKLTYDEFQDLVSQEAQIIVAYKWILVQLFTLVATLIP